MRALDPTDRRLAIVLAMLAGIVDAIGFLGSGGFFLSFMSGNSTRLSIGIAEHAPFVGFVMLLLLGFVSGVTGGSMVGRRGILNTQKRQAVLLAMIAILLFIAPWIAQLGYSTPALCIVTFCMGMENTLYERNGSVTFGLTYMTGALVKIGQGLATLLSGGERLAWLPFLLLWLGLIGGAVAGATLFVHFGFFSLWAGSALAAGCAMFLMLRR
jgi:uncharacterized membrane protein YoaK (UPF0700 family)